MIWLIALVIIVTFSHLMYKALRFLDSMDMEDDDWYN